MRRRPYTIAFLLMVMITMAAAADPAGLPFDLPPRCPTTGKATVILFTFAHPDDEILCNGTMMLAERAGYEVHVLYATNGDGGSDSSGRGLKGKALGEARAAEAVDVLNILNIKRPPVFLSIADGRCWDDRKSLAEQLDQAWQRIKPDIVITFGLDGATGHKDHMTIALETQLRFDRSEASQLYHIALTQAWADHLAKHVNGAYPFPGIVSDHLINARVDIRSVMKAKTAAMAAHKTQMTADEVAAQTGAFAAYGYETYILARRSEKTEK